MPWLIAVFSTLAHRRERPAFIYLSWFLLAVIVVSLPIGGDFNSIIERGEFELSAFGARENQDYVLLIVAYFSSALGIETPQGYSLIILMVLLKLRQRFGVVFLILNLIFFSYLGVTGYHRNYLSLLLLVWGFFGKNPVLILVAIFTHKAAFLYLMILLFSKLFRHLIYSKKNNLISFFYIAIVIILMLSLFFVISINHSYIGPFQHYFEHYIDYEADESKGAAFRYLSSLVTVFFFYIFHKNRWQFNFLNKDSLSQKETIELSMWLCLILSFVLLSFGFTIAPDRITLFSLILLSFLVSKFDNNPQVNVRLFIVASPIFISTLLWLFLSDKAYYLWGGQLFIELFQR